MSSFFLRRPVFAAVCSIIILLGGLIVLPTLAIDQYPQIAPPVVTVTASYVGASPEAVEAQVTNPLETAVNSAQGLRYISSTSAQGVSTITATFNLGVNLDIAAADVQNLVQSAIGLLPATVQQVGVTVAKNSGAFVMGVALISDNPKYDTLYLSNYAQLNIVNDLARIPGVSQVRVFGQRQYAMRIWIDPRKLAGQGLSTVDVVNALEEQNVEVAAGSVGAAPTSANVKYTYAIDALTQLSTPQQFSNIILRANPNGGFTRLGDVARIELGAQDYSSILRFDGHTRVVGMGILQYPDANALQVANAVKQKLSELAVNFPSGVHWEVAFSSTAFVSESIKEVVITLLLSVVLVILVIFLFLQDPKATLIPAATIPVSLIGAFFAMKVFGFSINTVTLFGLTLAAGLVVDDAIVVIENIARHMEADKTDGIVPTETAMREIQSAIVASSLVLFSVFFPVAFFPGTTGQLYKQFALTITAAIVISLFQALTLAPALAARLLHGDVESNWGVFRWFNTGLHNFRDWYARTLPKLFRRRWAVFGVFVAALLLTGFLFRTTPTAFIPDEDQGYFITLVQAPEGTSLAAEQQVAIKAERIILAQPEVMHVFNVGGFSFTGSAPNRGLIFTLLKPWGDRKGPRHSLAAILGRLNYMFYKNIPEAQIFAVNPPAINGVGSFGGYQFELEDRANLGLPALMNAAYAMMGAAAHDPRLSQVFTQFRINSPQLEVDIDRNKVKAVGASLTDVFNTMEVDLGSLYVNNFTYLNRSWQVIVQADEPYRSDPASLQYLYVPSAATPSPISPTASTNAANTGLTPLSAMVTAKMTLGAPVITHYNLYRNIELNGSAAPGHGSGEAIDATQQIAARVLPKGITYEWSGLQLDEIAAGAQSALIFMLGLVFVFLVLSAQYESFVDPLIVLLAVPAALLGALLFMNFRHIPLPFLYANVQQDAYAQVGYVMLIGLASKSAILIVEFANQQLRAGADVWTAALRAAQTRLRPILMTSIAFVIAMTPLVFASGAGSAARHSLGTVVFGGMLLSTFLNLAITPVLYVIIKGLEMRGVRRSDGGQRASFGDTAVEAPIGAE
ncbi:MAG TPA: efflux RND transporter permease subunit [Candidatus Baltobacteraceae bacterium]|nr:efflux RND transporter permease subunit [Candidatus Baltobacteraceae bacterium]